MLTLVTAVSDKDSPTFLSTGIVVGCCLFVALVPQPTLAEVPWECSNYEGAAQTRCVNAFIELQRDKIGQLEGQLQAQQATLNRQQDRLDRQASAMADLQRRRSDPPFTAIGPVPYAYSYWYPPALGLGLYLGRPRIYGAPFVHPFWGYRHWRLRR